MWCLTRSWPTLYDAQYYRRPRSDELLSQNIPVFIQMFNTIRVLLWTLIALGALILTRVWR